MELQLTVSYQPRITTNPVRYNSKMQNVLTDAEKFTYDAEFWNAYRDKFYLQTSHLDGSLNWHIPYLIGPVIDTNIIDVNSYEMVSFESTFNKNTYTVQFEVIIRFKSCENAESDELYVHKNRLVDLIVDWLDEDGIYENHAFISAGDEDLNATFGNVTVYYDIEVERDDVDVNIEVRK